MLEIPLLQIPNQELLVTLDGQDCTLHVYQRGREEYGRVYLDLAIDGEPIRQGAVCLPRVDILGVPTFSGQLRWTDELSEPAKQQPPHYSGFGERYHLYYLTADECAELESELKTELGVL